MERCRVLFSAASREARELSGRLGKLFITLKDIQTLLKKADIHPGGGLSHYRLGQLFGEIGLHRLATQAYAKALESGEDSFPVYFELGQSQIHLGRFQAAREYFHEAQKRNPNLEQVQKGLAEIQTRVRMWQEKAKKGWAEGNWIETLLYARKVLQVDIHCKEMLDLEGAAKRLREEKIARGQAACSERKRKRDQQREYQKLLAQGEECLNQGDFSRASEFLTPAVLLQDQDSEAEYLLACCYSEKGDLQRAKEILEALSAHHPASGKYLFTMGRTFLRHRHFHEAAEKLEMAAEKENQFFPVLPEAGTIYMAVQEYDKALSCFQRYVNVFPDHFESLEKMGTCYLAKGLYSQARAQYQQVLKISPQYLRAQAGLEKVEEMQGKHLPAGG